jgi:hypothetical protein
MKKRCKRSKISVECRKLTEITKCLRSSLFMAFNLYERCAAQVKRTALYGSARTGECWVAAMGKVAASSISMATRLSLDDCLYKWNTKKYMAARALSTMLHSHPAQ